MTWDTIKKYAMKAGGVVLMGAVAGAVVLMMLRNRVDPVPPQPDPTPTAPITLPAEVKKNAGELIRVDVKALKPDMPLTWDFVASDGMKFDREIMGTRAVIVPATEGELWVIAGTVADGKPFLAKSHVVSGKGPIPPPIPPDPKPPEPKPPEPKPVGGLRVIFVCESSDNLSKEQLNVWNSTKIAAYLNGKCEKDGTQPGWRKWDKDIRTDFETAAMRQLWTDSKAKLGTLPAVIVAIGQQATVYPIVSATEEDVLTLLQKAGG